MIKNKSEIEYLATPYSHEDILVRKFRFVIANKITATLIREGRIIFSPISHCHPLTEYGLPGSWEYWQKYSYEFLKNAKKLIIIELDGWEKSVGVQGEIKVAKNLGIPIEYIDPTPYLYRPNGGIRQTRQA